MTSSANFSFRPIASRDDPAVASLVRDVMTEHGATGEGCAIQDPEVDGMTAAYPPPEARYWVVVDGADAVVGGGGFARLLGTGPSDATCELRKMYFRPQVRGFGFGRMLLERVLDEARAAGYREIYLETFASMHAAQRLYRASGFAALDAPRGTTGHGRCDRWFARDL